MLSAEAFLRERSGYWVVITADEKNIPAIQNQMESLGMRLGEDLFTFRQFFSDRFPILSLWAFQKSYDYLCQISLTERCTLRCVKCAHGCHAVSSTAQDLTLEEVMHSVDVYFSHFDIVREFVLIGGEPLLYRDLAEAIDYIGKRYRHQMMQFSITTNGTILPDANVLVACKSHEVMFRISNYSAALPRLCAQHEKLCRLLEAAGISYILEDPQHQWVDYGFDSIAKRPAAEAAHVFDRCRTPCREIRGDRYYYCVMARSVNDNLGFGVGQNDYLCLSDLKGELGKKALVEYQCGFSEKGYLDMCRHCYGAEASRFPIPAAQQKKG